MKKEGKKIIKAIEVANRHGLTYEESLKYIKKYHPEWLEE